MKTRAGINFTHFLCITEDSNLNLHEWSNILHLSKRTMQRYKKENISFSPLQSEIILQVVLIFQKGHESAVLSIIRLNKLFNFDIRIP